jgi:6-phosphogluconolactonase
MMSVEILEDEDSLAVAAARFIARSLREVLDAQERATLVLSGGSTPRRIYRKLAEETSSWTGWRRVHIFWGDERSVPPDHEASNYRMAKESLLLHGMIPELNVHRVKGEAPPGEAAGFYEEEIRRFFSLRSGELPRFDLILLGLGTDGHVASLFPHLAGGGDESASVTVTSGGVPRVERITLTMSCINHASRVAFIVSGKSKAAVVRSVLEEADPSLPATSVRPLRGETTWFLDGAAASLLKKEAG